jgi:hypothetical protein
MEQVGKHGWSGLGADEALGLEGLETGVGKVFSLGIEQTPERAADGVRLQRLLQRAGLKEHGETRERALGHRGACKGAKCRPQVLLGLRRDRHAFAGEDRRHPLGCP